jgi:4'-phosphopantetheinyl transferase
MTEVYAITLAEADIFDRMQPELLLMLAPSQRPVSERYSHRTVFQRKVLGRVLLQWAAAHRYHLPANQLTVSKLPIGKPFFDKHPEIHFNVSHSGRWIVVALSEAPVGVDVEKVRNVNLAVARRFFASEEYHQLTSKPTELQRSFFFELWTLKESYLKALGTGLTRPLNTFEVRHEQQQFRLYANGRQLQESLNQLSLEDDYKLAVCSYEDNPAISLRNVAIETMLEK